jgi:UDP-N-acetyl-D-mannosaminuronic acid transferase (WecB/TagA/CpsF family)
MLTESIARANILGVGVSAINTAQALQTIDRWIRQHRQQYVCVTGVYGIMENQRDARLKQIHNHTGLVTPDGMFFGLAQLPDVCVRWLFSLSQIVSGKEEELSIGGED